MILNNNKDKDKDNFLKNARKFNVLKNQCKYRFLAEN